MTFKGRELGCYPTNGTIGLKSDNDGAADGSLSFVELLLHGDTEDGIRTTNDVLYSFDANGDTNIDRMEYEVWERMSGPQHHTVHALNLCQGPPKIDFHNSYTDEHFGCRVIELSHNELKCVLAPGEGKDLTAKVAGKHSTIGKDTGLGLDTDGASKGEKLDRAGGAIPFQFLLQRLLVLIPIVASISTQIPELIA